MKFFILNSSGNVGKSTVTREVLYSFMPKCKIFEIETVNASSTGFNIDVEKITDFTNFEDIYLKFIENDDLILDVGASNLSAFCNKLMEFAGIETLFDYFIIPTIPNEKVATDTARTILFLKSLGVPSEKIKVVFNNANTISEFEILLMQEEKIGYKFDTNLFIPQTNLFKELGILRKTINEIYCENVDIYKNEILNADAKDKLKLIKTDLANRMAVAIYPKLKDIYEQITNIKAINNLCFAQEKEEEKKAKDKKYALDLDISKFAKPNDDDEEL